MNHRSLLAVVLATLFAGCSQLAVKPAEPPAAPVAPAAPPKTAEVAEPQPNLPVQELKADILYKFLVAEIAGQRGQQKLATQTYLELARKTRDPRVAKRATEVAIYARDVTVASAAAQVWLDADPESPQPREALVSLLLNAKRLKDAKPHLQALIADQKGSPERDFQQLPRLLERQTDKAAAYELVRELAEPYGELAEAHYAVATAAQAAGELQAALIAIDRALVLKADWEAAAVLRASLLRKSAPETALRYLDGFVTRNPQAAEARLVLARILVSQRQYGAARKQFEVIEQVAPESADVALALALISFQLKDYAATAKYLGKTEQLDYKDKDLLKLYRGQLAEEEKRIDDAIAIYREVGGEHKASAQTRVATLLAKTGKLDEARQQLQKMHGVKDDKALMIQAEASILRDVKAYQEAFDLLSKSLPTYPNNTDLLYDRAMLAEKLNRLDVLEADLRRIIELKPNHAAALNALGYTLADRTTRYAEAADLIERALKLEPNDPFIMDSAGWVRYRLGDLKLAITHLRAAYDIRQDAEIAAHLGEVLWVDRQTDAAIKVWADALAEHPENEVLRETLQRLHPALLKK